MLKKTIISLVLIIIGIQFIGVDKTNPSVDKTVSLSTDKEVMDILKKGCYDCHSYETKWPSYSNIAPVSFFVASHVKNGRKALNFSEWEKISKDIKQARLKRGVITVNNGMMALPSYLFVHENSKLSKDEKKTLTNWFKKELKELEE